MSKKTLGILVLVAVIAFYSFGTGFDFFYRFLYVILALVAIGFVWAWLNLRGLQVELTRTANRGQVGEYLEGRIRVSNSHRIPKSWLEVVEVADLPDHHSGRGIALIRDQHRTWRIQTYLARRGVYHTGRIEITSRDPFGFFRLRRSFLDLQPYVVYPATHPLPSLDPRLADLPGTSRVTRHSDHVTTDASSVRPYAEGDSFRAIHWPYTAKMNSLMVKEFDMGMASEAWVLLDMQQGVHLGDGPDNSEELAVSIAASLTRRLLELSIPVGLAANGEQNYILRPDSSPGQQQRLLEVLAGVRAQGRSPLENFIYELEPYLSRFNTLTIITPNSRDGWLSAVNNLCHRGIRVSVIFIDARSFGVFNGSRLPVGALYVNDIPTYLVKRGQSLNEALGAALHPEVYASSLAATAGADSEGNG